MEHLIEEAFRYAINNEINSYRTFRNAAAAMPEGSGKLLLERLVAEERKIIEELCSRSPYPPSKVADLLESSHPHCLHPYPKESRDRKLFKHLRAALVDKHCCIEKYLILVTSFRQPSVCTVFEHALAMSRELYDSIAEAFRQIDLKLQIPTLDRRAKRAHIKPLNRPAPNRHTELFLSLVDSGRRSLF